MKKNLNAKATNQAQIAQEYTTISNFWSGIMKAQAQTFVDYPYERAVVTVKNMTEASLYNVRLVFSDYEGLIGFELDEHQLDKVQLDQFYEGAITNIKNTTLSVSIPEIKAFSRAVLTLKAVRADTADVNVMAVKLLGTG